MKRLVLTIFIIIFLYQSYMSLKKYLAKNISLRIEKKVYIEYWQHIFSCESSSSKSYICIFRLEQIDNIAMSFYCLSVWTPFVCVSTLVAKITVSIPPFLSV